jgi:hypothetical protein
MFPPTADERTSFVVGGFWISRFNRGELSVVADQGGGKRRGAILVFSSCLALNNSIAQTGAPSGQQSREPIRRFA